MEIEQRSTQEIQKERRDAVLHLASISLNTGQLEVVKQWKLDDPEIFWRIDSLLVWHNAIVGRLAVSRDYYDWLGPYLVRNAFLDKSYADFWLKDIEAAEILQNRWQGLIRFYQLERKISRGNAEDLNHAAKVFNVDLFLTGDKRLHYAMVSALTHFPNLRTQITLVDGSILSPIDAIREAIKGV